MQVELVNFSGSDLTIVNSARVSLGNTKQELDTNDIKLIKYLIKHNHVSTLEHCFFTFKLKVPIYVARQIMRHKSWSFNEISGRYVEFKDEFFIPDNFREHDKNIKQGSKSVEDSKLNTKLVKCIYKLACNTSYYYYNLLLKLGCCKEQSRGVLGLSLYTELYATCNLRSLYHFLKLRLDTHTQYETRFVSQQMLELVKAIPGNPFKYSLEAFNL